MSHDAISVTLVNHVAVDIACPPDTVWRAIVEDYVEAKRFREHGFSIMTLDNPAAFLGGYRMELVKDGAVVDRRECLITELDHDERRLGIVADYHAVPAGMKVYATYHAQARGRGTRYALDCHSTLGIERPVDASPDGVRAAVSALRAQYDAALNNFLGGVKARLEASD
jgi:hypothetical protein